jgi:hypothetical protein
VRVEVKVIVGVNERVGVWVTVSVLVGVFVTVAVLVGVGVSLAVGVGDSGKVGRAIDGGTLITLETRNLSTIASRYEVR